jgi:hypothetical protein
MPSTCVVNSLGDAGVGVAADHGDLRYCINRANALAGPDAITFSVTGTIKLTSKLPDLASDITMTGPGADLLTVDAGGHGRILTVAAGATVTVFGLTVTGGHVAANFSGSPAVGGGVSNAGTLTLSYVKVLNNLVTANNAVAEGGGVYNAGTLTVNYTSLSGNSATSGSDMFDDASLGGGIYNQGTLALNSSIVDGNYTDTYGGGSGGGGIVNRGSAALSDSTVVYNSSSTAITPVLGGGIAAYAGSLKVRYCTISRNTASGGGGSYGGGIYVYANAHLANMRDTILAGNQAIAFQDAGGVDLFGTIETSGYNLIGDSSGGSGYVPTDLVNVDPLLNDPRYNGGPTKTMALLPGSPAIDSGDNTGAPMWDQRGPGYPRIVNGTIDRGAFEVQSTDGAAGAPSVLATARISLPAAVPVPQGESVAGGRPQSPVNPAPADVAAATPRPAPPVVATGRVPLTPGGPESDPFAPDGP